MAGGLRWQSYQAHLQRRDGRHQRVGGFAEPVRPLDNAPAHGHGRASDGSAPSTLILGSDGWRPIAKTPKDPKADAEFEAAKKLFEQGKFAEAEKAICQDRQGPQGDALGRDRPVLPGRDAISARKIRRCSRQLRETLTTIYPATDYREKLVSREFAIAQLWNLQYDPNAPKDKLLPWYRRFDGGLPIIDTSGYALKALEHVRHNDPTGDRWPTMPQSRSRIIT